MYTKENTKKNPEIYFSLELRIENHIRGKLSPHSEALCILNQ